MDVFGGGSGLAVEESRDGDFGTTQLLGQFFKGQVVLGFGFEEQLGGGWEMRFELALKSG